VARVERHARDARRRAGHRVLGQLGGQRMRLCASLFGQFVRSRFLCLYGLFKLIIVINN
jgi:hypothetical protein